MSSESIVVENLSGGRPKEKVAFEGVTLALPPQGFLLLLGPPKAGKTALIRSLLGLQKPIGGSIRALGMDPLTTPEPFKQRLGYVAQALDLCSENPVKWLLALHENVYPKWDAVWAATQLTQLKIEPKTKPRLLTLEQKANIALLCARASQPDLLVVDDPCSRLDPIAGRKVRQTIIRYLDQPKTTTIYATRECDIVSERATHLAYMKNGHLCYFGELDKDKQYCEILAKSADHKDLSNLAKCVTSKLQASGTRLIMQCNETQAREVFSQAYPDTEASFKPLTFAEFGALLGELL